ncbi:hypothetical protein HanPSC8_Chr16g0729301 [Helianthus annuus]|nr:hypothetical protein HanHA89_Chr16g0671491 [Helianthus annuus]KAJ0641799.1 hypothetical protein HanLR1_Chr16g0631171 [Helianthus annuus]KAJ0822209.1 hypothetical protein HanPSC8_Chr16g0729301 [Helianthus annuus]
MGLRTATPTLAKRSRRRSSLSLIMVVGDGACFRYVGVVVVVRRERTRS